MQRAYKSVINRIAIALIFNAALFVLLSSLFAMLEGALIGADGVTDLEDAILTIVESVVYFASFTLPVLLFSRMTEQAGEEILLPESRDRLFSRAECALAIAVSLGAISASAYLNYFIVDIFPNYSDFASESFWSVRLEKPYQIALYFFGSACVPAICEELLFRGTVCRALLPFGKGYAVIVSALLFSLMHTNVQQTLYTLVGGLCLGLIYVKTESVVYPILLHFINNSVSIAETVIIEKLPKDQVSTVVYAIDNAIVALGAISLVCLVALALIRRKTCDFKAEREAPLLNVRDRIKGFFSLPMMLYVVYCVGVAVYYIYLSYK